jgi:hypothetical protein
LEDAQAIFADQTPSSQARLQYVRARANEVPVSETGARAGQESSGAGLNSDTHGSRADGAVRSKVHHREGTVPGVAGRNRSNGSVVMGKLPSVAGLPRQRRGLFRPWCLVATATTNGMETEQSVAARGRAYQGLQRLNKRGAPPRYVGSERRDGGRL